MPPDEINEADYMPEEINALQEINVAAPEPVQLDFFKWLDNETSKEKGKSFYQWLSDSL